MYRRRGSDGANQLNLKPKARRPEPDGLVCPAGFDTLDTGKEWGGWLQHQ